MALFGQTKSRLSTSNPSSPIYKPRSARSSGTHLPLSNADASYAATSSSNNFNEKMFGGSHSRSSSLNGGAFGFGNGGIGSGGIGGSGTGGLGITAVGGQRGWYTVLLIPLPRRLFGRRGPGSPSLGSSSLSGTGHDPYSRGGSSYPSSSSTSPTSHSPPRRHIRIPLPIPPTLFSRIVRSRLLSTTSRKLLVLLLVIGLVVLAVIKTIKHGGRNNGGGGGGWASWDDDTSLVFTEEELSRIWEWELRSGHHPSLREVPERIPLPGPIQNPSVPGPPRNKKQSQIVNPARPLSNDSISTSSAQSPIVRTLGSGPARRYLSLKQSARTEWRAGKQQREYGFPPRPVRGSVADLDRILQRCDFAENKYVRDCLEFLRIGGSLDNGRRYRRTNLTSYQYIYEEEDAPASIVLERLDARQKARITLGDTPRSNMTTKSSKGKALTREPLVLPAPLDSAAPSSSSDPCDPTYPRIFHMFWAGDFTDKPYMAVMSFLFTQNLGLELGPAKWKERTEVCRPQFWVWINPGPAAAVPNPSAEREMNERLAKNPWSAPFFHARFQDVVKFKMWNTTEQLDGIPEIAEHWRSRTIFNSGGNTYGDPQSQATPPPQPESFAQRDIDDTVQTDLITGTAGERTLMDGDGVLIIEIDKRTETGVDGTTLTPTPSPPPKERSTGIFEIVGSTSENEYDRLSVILSDLARFVLTHRFGGIYLDADTLFLRDWEELWNWKGQFAYRWSWHDKYNTAVLKLNKGSALGTFLFKTALENKLDLHPMTVSKYLMEADLDRLLFRLPDALFDPAWLNMEGYQRDRPPFPYFPEFKEFFSNNRFTASSPHPLGFEGFYRGAFSYHFHNGWWQPFDPSRNWPDLGHRFIKGEKVLRQAARAAKLAVEGGSNFVADNVDVRDPSGDTYRDRHAESPDVDVDEAGESDFVDEDDLSWSTVLKRTFEAYLRGERPNMYGEWLRWEDV